MVKAVKQIFSHVGYCNIIITDHSTSFDGQFAAFLSKHNIIHFKRTSRSSRETGAAESCVRIVREHITRIILASASNLRNRWDEFLYAIMASFNLRGPQKLPISRTQLYYGSNFYISAAARFLESDDVENLHDKIMATRHTGQHHRQHDITENSFVVRIIPTKLRTIENTSRYLLPSSPTVYTVLNNYGNSLRLMNLNTGVTTTCKAEEVRLLTPSEYCLYTPQKLINSIYQRSKPNPGGHQPFYRSTDLYVPPKDTRLYKDYMKSITGSEDANDAPRPLVDTPEGAKDDGSSATPPATASTKVSDVHTPENTPTPAPPINDHPPPGATVSTQPQPDNIKLVTKPNQTVTSTEASMISKESDPKTKTPQVHKYMISDEIMPEENQTKSPPQGLQYMTPRDPIMDQNERLKKKISFDKKVTTKTFNKGSVKLKNHRASSLKQ